MAERRTLQAQAATINAVLKQHRVPSHVGRMVATPRSARFELLAEGTVALQSVQNLTAEIAAALGAGGAEVRRDQAGVCVEVPQPPAATRLLPLCDQLDRVPALTTVLGVDSDGAPLLLRLPAPEVGHVLVTGMTGAGKTALVRTMLTSLTMFNAPARLHIVLIDPKARGFSHLLHLPHMLGDLVSAPEDARACLQWLVDEMERRTATQAASPAIVVAVDELADLIQTGGNRIEALLTRICEGGMQAGIHVIASTQKPTAEFIGSGLKDAFRVRLVGAVASREEARFAAGITESGAERLEGKGDFLLITGGQSVRFQAAWIGPKDLEHAIALLRDEARPAQWARPALQPAPVASRASGPAAAAAGAAHSAYALLPEAGRTFWQSIVDRLLGL